MTNAKTLKKLLNVVIKEVDPNEFKAIMSIYWQTVGSKQEWVRLTFAEIGRACGMSKRTAFRAVHKLLDNGYLVRDVVGVHRGSIPDCAYKLTLE